MSQHKSMLFSKQVLSELESYQRNVTTEAQKRLSSI